MSEPKLDDDDRSHQSKLAGSIEDCKHSEMDGASGDLPTPPYGHPSSEGISRRKIIGYERYLKELARKLRQNMTLGEVLLWQRLKRKQMRGYHTNLNGIDDR